MPARFQKARDPMSSYTHYIAAWMSLVGMAVVVAFYFIKDTAQPLRLFAALVFCASMLALYSASACYHFCTGSAQKIFRLRKLDHAMIYLLIAGSYTPMVLTFFPRQQGLLFAAAMWGIAALGVVMKVFWFGMPRWISTALYLIMGWAILLFPNQLAAIPAGAVGLLAAGGVSYTIGGVIYVLKKPNPSPAFGFHELFHIFVMLGSFFHFLVLLCYVL